MPDPGEEQRDLAPVIGGHDPGGEDTRALALHIIRKCGRTLSLSQLQHLHGGVVVVNDPGLCGLINQLFVCAGNVV
jgi:hypothetical protein